jgi:hypothetical protein
LCPILTIKVLPGRWNDMDSGEDRSSNNLQRNSAQYATRGYPKGTENFVSQEVKILVSEISV